MTMQHPSSCNLATLRDRDFLAACRRVLAGQRRTDLTAAEVARMAANSPAPSYYLTYEYARRMLSERRRGMITSRNTLGSDPSQSPHHSGSPIERRREEIAGKVKTLMERTPGLKMGAALSRVLAGPASSFFLAPDTARKLFATLRRGSAARRHSQSVAPHLSARPLRSHTPLRRPLLPNSAAGQLILR